MVDKFSRNYRLYIGSGNEQIVIEPPLTLGFSVKRSTLSSANTGQFTILNLSKSVRDRIFLDRYDFRRYFPVTLLAGYRDQLTTIFRGNVRQAGSQRQGNNIVTQIDAWDGGFDMAGSITNTTFSGGSLRDLVKTLSGDFSQVTIGQNGNFDDQYQKPIVLVGNTYDLVRKYTRNQVFVEFEQLKYIKENEVLQGIVPVLNSQTGLINVRREGGVLNVEAIFEPRIIMGQVISIKSSINSQFDGQYKAIGVNHQGTISEAVGGDCKSTFEFLVGSQLFGGFSQI